MNTQLMRASDVSGLPVVTIDAGDDIAEIKDVVFDGTDHRLVGFTLNKRGWFSGTLSELLATSSINAIGPDAVMVDTETDLSDPDDSPSALSGDSETHVVVGNKVVAADGTALGTVRGVVISTGEQPAAVGYEVEDNNGQTFFVPVSAQMALSDDNLLVPEESTDFIRNDLAGFGAAVAEHRAALDGATKGDHR